MSGIRRIALGKPLLLEFRGPDAVRFLNGQLTQDVRRLVGAGLSLPSCVTDAKGRLQFRVSITENDGCLWVSGLPEWAEALEGRLTRYLIADDVEVADLTGQYTLWHFTGKIPQAPEGVVARASNRYGVDGTDWWIPAEAPVFFPAETPLLEGEALEVFRIAQGIPAWGAELREGILPPEAGLDLTDISYQKGCYIGQEVISRIKSAGKVNKRLTRFSLPAESTIETGALIDAEGAPAGEITSISPEADGGLRKALGYAKRGAETFFMNSADGTLLPVKIL